MSAELERLARVLRGEGGLLGAAVADGAPDPDTGAYAGGLAAPRAFAVEAIREGHLLHHGRGRVIGAVDADLALLAGDRLYALGLAELAAAGDLEAVGIMAEVIARCAGALGEGDRAGAEVAWQQGVRALAR